MGVDIWWKITSQNDIDWKQNLIGVLQNYGKVQGEQEAQVDGKVVSTCVLNINVLHCDRPEV